MPEDVKYDVNGQPGKQCKDCSEFTAHADDAAKGDCHGHEVVATGTCNFFHAAAAKE